jgi:hypothetical protein
MKLSGSPVAGSRKVQKEKANREMAMLCGDRLKIVGAVLEPGRGVNLRVRE